MKFLYIIIPLLTLFSCQQTKTTTPPPLSIVTLVNRNGMIETVNNKERLIKINTIDFSSPQPYYKVLRVFQKDLKGQIPAILTCYHPNGELYLHLSILNGRARGKLSSWYSNGKKMFETHVIEGIPDINNDSEKSWVFDKEAKAWDEEGHLLAHFNYSKGALEGPTTYYYPTGQIKEKKIYKKSALEGTSLTYYPDGTLYKKTTYKNNQKEGLSETYWKNGSIAANEDFLYNTLSKGEYFTETQVQFSKIDQGSGVQVCVCEDQSFYKIEHKKGQAEGFVHKINQKGQVAHIYHQLDGHKHGKEILFFPNTEKKTASIEWCNGKVHGITQTWYPNGAIQSQKELSENKKNGLSLAWYEKGELMLIEEYENNDLIKGEYFEKGNKKPITRIIAGNGIATLFDKKGHFLKKTIYENSKPQ